MPSFPPRLLPFAFLVVLAAACAATTHPVVPSELGRPTSSGAAVAELAKPGPIRFERIVAAEWQVDRAGLINLDHPRAKEAGIQAGLEPIEIYFYVLEHPQFGTWIVDSGVSERFVDPEAETGASFLVEHAMNTDLLDVHVTTRSWFEELLSAGGKLDGVLITHTHLDHIMGLPDLPASTPVYAGPGEPEAKAFLYMLTQGTIDRFLGGGKGPLREWQFAPDPDGRFEGMLDVFGDGSLFALHVPGHTPGSTAFFVRSTDGPKLLTGDASHTAFGWKNGVESGTFTHDGPRSVESLARLRKFAAEFPKIEVHIGHQRLEGGQVASFDICDPPHCRLVSNSRTEAVLPTAIVVR
jgi:N-acyl homoserine lactone hydrolase